MQPPTKHDRQAVLKQLLNEEYGLRVGDVAIHKLVQLTEYFQIKDLSAMEKYLRHILSKPCSNSLELLQGWLADYKVRAFPH